MLSKISKMVMKMSMRRMNVVQDKYYSKTTTSLMRILSLTFFSFVKTHTLS